MPKSTFALRVFCTIPICLVCLALTVGCGSTASEDSAAADDDSAQTEGADTDQTDDDGDNVAVTDSGQTQDAGDPETTETKEPDALYSPQAFRMAAHDGKLRVVEICIQGGLDVNEADAQGFTPLAMAAYNGHDDVVKLLIDNKATVDTRDRTGMTPLIHAASFPSPETVKLLLDAGADIQAAGGNESWTPLMMAAAEGNIEVVKLLIAEGAKKDTVDADGDTARHFAIEKGHTAIAELLDAE